MSPHAIHPLLKIAADLTKLLDLPGNQRPEESLTWNGFSNQLRQVSTAVWQSLLRIFTANFNSYIAYEYKNQVEYHRAIWSSQES